MDICRASNHQTAIMAVVVPGAVAIAIAASMRGTVIDDEDGRDGSGCHPRHGLHAGQSGPQSPTLAARNALATSLAATRPAWLPVIPET